MIRSTSRRSRTRRHTRTSICDRTALLPMASWVGFWVAARMFTATARPRRATESAYSCASAGSSAYSSTTIISAGLPADGSHTRFPWAVIRAARLSSSATASANSVTEGYSGRQFVTRS
jgi:hypothetical protein